MAARGRTQPSRQTLATDLDGTLIPLADNRRNEADLRTLRGQLGRDDLRLIFVTGRHLESVRRATAAFDLPLPELVICDVGATVATSEGPGTFVPDPNYRTHLEEIVKGMPPSELRGKLPAMEGLRLQEEESQSRFKLSYYADPNRLEILVARLRSQLERLRAPYSMISSIDPFTGKGLIDFLPAGVSKAGALAWWVRTAGVAPESIVFAGDSGNDLAALTAGYRSIVVGNAPAAVARGVWESHREQGWVNRLYLAQRVATSGLLEGCRWFELVEPEESPKGEERFGATPISLHRTRFRVWAPRAKRVEVELGESDERERRELGASDDGVFEGLIHGAGPGTLYRYVLDGGTPLPDPVSRFQPEGIRGPSRVVAPHGFPWTDQEWRGVPKHRLLFYELHVGAFTRKGTLRAATERLSKLVELGVTAVELMPVVQTSGRWNWGYDGVDLYAVRNTYGEPDDLKLFVDACHARGLAVILDVVYNHLGPEGGTLGEFGPYLSEKHTTPWGEAFNFDGEGCERVRAFILDNALELLRENHLDGLRVDSVHHMFDESSPGILADLKRTADEFAAAARRPVHLIHETNVFDAESIQPEEGTPRCDAIWCDDLMYSLLTVARPELQLTPRHYEGATDLARVLRDGCVYVYEGHEAVRVEDPVALAVLEDQDSLVASFVTSLQNHDGVGNHPGGKRVHQLASKAFQRAAAALNLLTPGLPLLFMGEEWALDAPFPFFCDHEDPRVRKRVETNRARETSAGKPHGMLPPLDEETFRKARWDEAMSGDEEMFAWYRKLIILRKEGLREGWLAMERLRVEHTPKTGVFVLRYARQYGASIELRARLTPASEPDLPPVAVPCTGHVLLSSRPDCELKEGRLRLLANHAVVSLASGQERN